MRDVTTGMLTITVVVAAWYVFKRGVERIEELERNKWRLENQKFLAPPKRPLTWESAAWVLAATAWYVGSIAPLVHSRSPVGALSLLPLLPVLYLFGGINRSWDDWYDGWKPQAIVCAQVATFIAIVVAGFWVTR